MNIVAPDETGLAQALEALACDEVVAYPTETVYGLAVNPLSEKALDRLFSVKKREPAFPVLLIVADETQLRPFAAHIDDRTRACMQRFWPGPLSLLFPAAEGLPRRILSDSGQVCLRCPEEALARRLCLLRGGALTSTSANLSGHAPARSAEEAALPGVALVLDGGALPPREPSTVFDAAEGRVVRAGALAAELLYDCWNG
ncbi:MAG TPA: L-threonylcarbamoyladenylate synthase [Candidatus Hydrogenedentes bacterium]|jgi:L-threonylcarbamoyladenylate synthase|nr:MAG: Threonylcarbamoyl-AMP synthase [Candidatus Hydrogenedentes bacterium ADurb.Bin170]HOD94725.1 L-threonylcarbamoyladenylate synthase [Candidatus Hydrogenedentota bacterium]HOM48603.1 L-threonylcarbamoyladenylate synthase [Candidatus Hydrogenedentota bacterium]HOR50252.1 L-threonylcarbamoyladenylate synthase [Candidatus Hydrogenedentota bacterium]HPK24306.1 L-threonylcarbamoyladenylate synthase [Candidatus Hydrogenedentota bacterium]